MKPRIQRYYWKLIASILEPTLRYATFSRQHQIQLTLNYRETVYAQDKSLDFEQAGFNVYSSTYEDGILLYIFALIGMAKKRLVDIGSGAIKGSNTANLIVNHAFTGLLIDGNPNNIQKAKAYYHNHPETEYFPPQLVSTLVTAENINRILMENDCSDQIDLLAIDIDGIDYWVWKAIDIVSPRVVLVEYQDILGPDRAWTVPYKPNFNLHDYPQNKNANNYCGASLRAFVNLARSKGYRLTGCNRGGWNAFFIQEGICEQYLPEVTVESCFKHENNRYGMEKRFQLVKDMEWQEV